MGKFTAAEKAECAQREAKMRRRVYGKKGGLTRNDEREIAMMEEIATEYEAAAKTEEPSLFTN